MQALSMDEAKQKLTDLEKYLPSEESPVYDFGKFLSKRLNSQLVPQGFIMACELALYDLQTGVDGFTGKPIQSNLVGYPPIIYAALRISFPRIAQAIFPADFAGDVKTFVDEVNKTK